MRHKSIFFAPLLACGLLMTGCSDDAPEETADAGIQATPDAGRKLPPLPDAGGPEVGPSSPCPRDETGCACDFDAEIEQGSCMGALDHCVSFSEDHSTAICHRPCDADVDCQDTKIAGFRSAATCGGLGYCVEKTAGWEEPCRLKAFAGRELIGCTDGASCELSVLSQDNPPAPAEGICLRRCVADDAEPGCPPEYSSCKPYFSDFGFCGKGGITVGGRCNASKAITEGCDWGIGSLTCITGWQGLESGIGFCLERCTPEDPTCELTADEALGEGSCVMSSETTGYCSLPCNVSPNNDCTNEGLGGGSVCARFFLGSSQESYGLCRDVLAPVLEKTTYAVTGEGELQLDTLGGECKLTRENAYADRTPYQCPSTSECWPIDDSPDGCVDVCSFTSSSADHRPENLEREECGEGQLCYPVDTSTITRTGLCATPL